MKERHSTADKGLRKDLRKLDRLFWKTVTGYSPATIDGHFERAAKYFGGKRAEGEKKTKGAK